MNEPDEIDRSGSGLAVAALVLGILGFVLLPVVIGGLFGLAACVVALLHLRSRPQGRGLAITGLVFGAVALAGSLAAGLLYFYMYREYRAHAEAMRAEDGEDGDEGDDGPGRDHPSWLGRAAPALTLTTIDGETVQLDQLRGRPVVLDFWATWCAACKQELPALNRVAREHPDVVILGISDEPTATLKAFADKHPFDFRIASLASSPAPFDDVSAIPTNVFIDRQGIIRDVHVGALSHEQILAKATAPDYDPAAAAAAKLPLPAEGLDRKWTAELPGVDALSVCDWDHDGALDVLAKARMLVSVLDGAGREKARVRLEERGRYLECAALPDGSVRLLTHDPWGHRVDVLDGSGKKLWSYSTPSGIDGAHWGDLDGDGSPELVIGMNGDGGLHAVSLDGKLRWRASDIGNVWQQAVVPGANADQSIVLTTASGGEVHVYDGRGAPKATLEPLQKYYAVVAGTRLQDGALQILGLGEAPKRGPSEVVAFDLTGTVAWKAPAIKPRAPTESFFAGGDLDGKGDVEWVFPASTRPPTLAVYSARGERLASLPLRSKERARAVLGMGSGRKALLIVAADALHAYELK